MTFTMKKQLNEEKSYIHPHILLESLAKSQKKYITIENVRDIHGEHLPYIDYLMDTMMSGKPELLGVEGKRDTYRLAKEFENEHLVSEIFGHVGTDVLNLQSIYKHILRRRIKKGSEDYRTLRKHILDLIRDYDKYFPRIKYGYGFVDNFNLPEGCSPIFSYYWFKWKKAGIFRGDMLRDFTKQCFYDRDQDCKFQLSPNTSWTTVNLLIPFKKLQDNGILIDLVDFDEESVSKYDKILMLDY